jgi:hypothetical protein
MRKRKTLKVVFVNLLLLFIGIFLLEIVFGGWLSENRLNKLNLIRDVDLTYDLGDLYQADNKQIRYKRDSYGLRGNYGTPDKIDILTVGGSTTDQRFISEGATWQDVMQREFAAHGKTVHIANAGVDGQSTYGHIKDFDWWFPYIPNLRVRHFLFYIGGNDLHKEANNEYDDLYDRPTSTYGRLKEGIEERSVFYHWYRTWRGIWAARSSKIGHRSVDFQNEQWVEAPIATHHQDLMARRLQGYEQRLKVLSERVRQLGGLPIYVTQPTGRCKTLNGKTVGVAETEIFEGIEINGIDRCIMVRMLNNETMEFCRRVGGICVDLAGELEFADGDFYDFSHNTPRGSEKIGVYLYQKLQDRF